MDSLFRVGLNREGVLSAVLAALLCGCTYSFYDKRPPYQAPTEAPSSDVATLHGSQTTFLVAVDGRLYEPKSPSIYAQSDPVLITAGDHQLEVGWSPRTYTFGRVELNTSLSAGRTYAIRLERDDGAYYVSIVEEPGGKLASNRVQGKSCPSPMGIWGCDPVK